MAVPPADTSRQDDGSDRGRAVGLRANGAAPSRHAEAVDRTETGRRGTSMAELPDLIDLTDARLTSLRDGPVRTDGRCVLLWVQRAKRATGNSAANAAVAIADRLKVPVVAAFCLVPVYPRATDRAYGFMAAGLQELPDAFAARGIGWALRVGEPEDVIPTLARELHATAIVTDQDPLRLGRQWRRDVAARSAVPTIAVDADTVAPPSLFPKEEWAARTIRPKIWRAIDAGDYLAPRPDRVAAVPATRLDVDVGPHPMEALGMLGVAQPLAATPAIVPGPAGARQCLDRFVRERLAVYHTVRDQADRDGQSGLGPYLHFGQIGPVEVAQAVIAAKADGGNAAGADAFLDELIVQRELAINFALRNPAYDRYQGIPDWGQRTLAAHDDDPRPELYDQARLEAGETADRLWNAAQRQMVAEGTMPNRLRMYWAKQILRWTASAEAAFAITTELNDRYFLCGRDAAGYANIAWAIGGRHDRPFPPEKPIIGLVRPLGIAAMKRHFDPERYIARIEERLGERVPPAPAAQRAMPLD